MQCGQQWKKPASRITDRAKRYRVQKAECRPAGPQRCELCNSTRFLVVDHRDGNEANSKRGNLRWLCKSCNTRVGARNARQGRGVRTRQYNPAERVYRWRSPKYPDWSTVAGRNVGEAKKALCAELGLSRCPAGFELQYVRKAERNPGPLVESAIMGAGVAVGSVLAEPVTRWGMKVIKDAIRNPAAEKQWAVEVLSGRREGCPDTAREMLTNPAEFGGHSFDQVSAAIASVSPQKKRQGEFFPQMPLAEARAIVRDVERSGDMSAFQREVWRIRKQRYGGGGEVPF